MVMVDLSNKVADTVLSPVYFNIFSKKTSGSIEVKFFGAFIIRRDNTFIIVLINCITKMATMHICGKIFWKSLCGYSLKVQSEI